MMTPRLLNLAIVLVWMSSPCFSQSDPNATTHHTYTLEAVATSSAACPEGAVTGKTRARVKGMMLVTESGAVGDVSLFNADPALASAAEAALKKWSFKPVMKDGHGVAVVPIVAVDYTGCDAQHTEVRPEIGNASDFPEQVRVSTGVFQRMILKTVNPKYPDTARKAHLQGRVSLTIEIDRDGRVTDVKPESGPSELIPAAVDAVRQWSFRPYLFLGQPVGVKSSIAINFSLSGM